MSPTLFILCFVALIVFGVIFFNRKRLKSTFFLFGDIRDTAAASDHFRSYDWNRLKNAFNEAHKDLGPDRLDRAFIVYHRIMVIAFQWNILRQKDDPHVKRIAPFDKDVDTFWRFHASQPDYDAWCTHSFGAVMQPRKETHEEPTWKTREERQKTKVAYKKKFGLQQTSKDENDDFIPPIIVV